MFSSLKNSRNGFHALAFLCALAWLSGCGNMLGGGGRSSSGGGNSPFGNSGKSTNSSGGSVTTRTNTGGSGGVNTGYSQELQTCDQYRQAGLSIVNPCGAIFQQNIEELSSGCRTKFNDLYNTDCNGLKARLEGVFNACNSDISEAMPYLPANCQSALRRFIK